MNPWRACILPIFIVTGIVLAWAQAARGLEAGVPIYAKDVNGRFMIEVRCEQFDKDIERTTTPYMGSYQENWEENRLRAQFTCMFSKPINVFADAGIVDARDADGVAPIFGGGIKLCAYENEGLRLNLFASGYYVSGIKFREDYIIVFEGTPADNMAEVSDIYPPPYDQHLKREIDYYEVGGGFSLSKEIPLENKMTLTPYGGLVVSYLRGDGEEELKGIRPLEKTDIEFEGDGWMGLHLGVAVNFRPGLGLSLEGRFIKQSSVSAGLYYAF